MKISEDDNSPLLLFKKNSGCGFNTKQKRRNRRETGTATESHDKWCRSERAKVFYYILQQNNAPVSWKCMTNGKQKT